MTLSGLVALLFLTWLPQQADQVRVVSDVARVAAFYERLGCRRDNGADGSATLTWIGSRVRIVRGETPSQGSVCLPAEEPGEVAKLCRHLSIACEELPETSRRSSFRVRDPEGGGVVFRHPEDVRRPPRPVLGALNPYVVEVLREYPTDGKHPYHWPKSGGWRGSTKDLFYAMKLVSAGDPEGRAYCCGLTFEVFLEAWMRWCRHEGRPERIDRLTLEGVRKLQSQWFGSASDRTCLRTALLKNGLGVEVSRKDARAGDFVQLWRQDGTGHSVIFIAWAERDGRRDGLVYWSTQRSTRGIGERTEWFGTSKKSLKQDEVWICRVGVENPGRDDQRAR